MLLTDILNISPTKNEWIFYLTTRFSCIQMEKFQAQVPRQKSVYS